MKIILFIFAAAQILHCSGIPCASSPNSEPPIAISETIAKVNEQLATSNLFAIVKCELISRIDFGERVFEINITIDIQETVCNVSSGMDPANCALIPIPDAITAYLHELGYTRERQRQVC
ncbi:secreted phosphoprotein 24-like [Scyliorhinus canicula]|uniref:secreted phosphoprotein 24-like n=1 Tax=Scyliorhinus canicula TaxID=7830 RepID=UPI0018F6E9A2|nr:secreted phosphoprotein 24-like [Scyliorhinus canicula]